MTEEDNLTKQEAGVDADENADAGNEDNKSEGADDSKEETLTLRIKNQAAQETLFKVKKKTKMGKIFEAYAQRNSLNKNALRFLLDGDRLNEEDTPEGLDLEDKDQIDVVLEQTGGSF
eukprot:augustus_masked-scaffold_67-processed-gene-0.18-mRNA-1 protein AED:0.06 eAED:0.06 QI:0/-1/0/1/-1/1/1/0/117